MQGRCCAVKREREKLLLFERAAIYALSRFMTLFLAPLKHRLLPILSRFLADIRSPRVWMIARNVPGLKFQGMIHARDSRRAGGRRKAKHAEIIFA